MLQHYRETIADMAAFAQRWGRPVGNSEGWGPVVWLDHPLLDWRVTRACAELALPLAAAAGFAFNSSCNQCGPQFPGLWREVDWHRARCSEIHV